MARSKPQPKPPAPGSIAHVVAHLALWGGLAPRGFGRVIYHSEFARQRAVGALKAALEESGTPFHTIDLPLWRSGWEVVRFLVDHLEGLAPGVVSISGFATAFTEDEPLPDSLYALNFNRENLARFPLRQVWWMTPHFADTFMKVAPDLYSWFMVRLRLTEDVPHPKEGGLIFERPGSHAVNIDEARRRAVSLAARARRAVEAGQPRADIRRDLALPAVKALYDAGAEAEARAMLTALALLLGESEEQLGAELGVGSALPLEMNDLDRSGDLNKTALLLSDLGNYQAAEPLYRRALDINEKVLGPDHSDTARSLNNLATLYHDQGRYDEAGSLFRRALDICKKVLGPDHPHTATCLNNLASLNNDRGRYDEVEPLYRRALDIHEKALGPDHPYTATSLSNLAGIFYNQGRYAEAESLYQRAFTIWEKVLGPDHPDTARSLNNLAVLYNAQGRYAEAEPLYRRAFAIWEKVLGPDHPDTAISLNNLACFLNAQGRYDEAEPLYRRALAIRAKVLGPDHPNVAAVLWNLADLLAATDRQDEAEALRERARAILESHVRANPGATADEDR